MDRTDLLMLNLEELRRLAEQRGLRVARTLGRPQLIDELSAPATERRRPLSRRLLGLVQRSLSRMLATARRRRDERHAATSRQRPDSGQPDEVVYPPPQLAQGSRPSSQGAVRGPEAAAGAVDRAHLSQEMARAYAAQGRREEALAIYRLLLVERPGDPELLRRLGELEREAPVEEKARERRPKLSPSAVGPHSEPYGMLDLEELPETYGISEVEVLYKDPFWAFVYWEVTEAGIEAARVQLGTSGPQARLVLRMFTTQLGAAGATREIRDVPLLFHHGRRYVEVPRPGSLLRVAVGLLSAEGYFAPIAHSSLLRLPPPYPGPVTATVDWMYVQPPRGRGEQRERITILSRAVHHHERAVPWRIAEPVGAPQAPGAGVARQAGPDRPTSPGPTSPGPGPISSGGLR
jgi:hypothetical protein